MDSRLRKTLESTSSLQTPGHPFGPDPMFFSPNRPIAPSYASKRDDRPSYSLFDRDDHQSVQDDDPSPLPLLLVPPSSSSIMGAGLANLGNTCFLNAILQCVTHTVPLLQSLLFFNHVSPHKCCYDDFCAFCALRQHIELAFECSGKMVSPFGIVNNLRYISDDFLRFRQEDAHEFLQRFLEKLSDSSPFSKTGVNNTGDNNLVNHIFGGRLISKLRCYNCGYISDTYEHLIDLSLEIKDVDNLVSALESFTKVEKMEDPESMFTCENCKKLVTGEKQLMLDSAPSVATFHLKRFKNDGEFVEKIDRHVDFPLELDLKPFTSCFMEDNGELKYELYAVVVHDGVSSTSGHYFSFVRSSPDTWHKLDDSMVFKVPEYTVLSQNAYILFYTRQGTPWFSSLVEANKTWFELNMSNTSPKSTSPTSVLDNVYDINNIVDGTSTQTPLGVSDAHIGPSSDIEKMSPIRGTCDQINESPENAKSYSSTDIYRSDSPEIEDLPTPPPNLRTRKTSSCKRPKESSIEDSKRKEACRYVMKTMSNSRSAKFLAAMRMSPEKKKRRMK